MIKGKVAIGKAKHLLNAVYTPGCSNHPFSVVYLNTLRYYKFILFYSLKLFLAISLNTKYLFKVITNKI